MERTWYQTSQLSLGMNKLFHPIPYNGWNYLSMFELKLIHVSKRGPSIYNSCTVMHLIVFHQPQKKIFADAIEDFRYFSQGYKSFQRFFGFFYLFWFKLYYSIWLQGICLRPAYFVFQASATLYPLNPNHCYKCKSDQAVCNFHQSTICWQKNIFFSGFYSRRTNLIVWHRQHKLLLTRQLSFNISMNLNSKILNEKTDSNKKLASVWFSVPSSWVHYPLMDMGMAT